MRSTDNRLYINPPIFLTLLACLVFLLLPAAAKADRPTKATLTLHGDMICQFPTGGDHQLSTTTLPIQIPQQDGPIDSIGHYQMTGTISGGYALGGKAVYRGTVKDDTLLLTFGQWYYQGKGMNNSSSFNPTTASPSKIPLEPDATLVREVNDPAPMPCKGKVTYNLKIEPETQTWDIKLTGQRKITFPSARGVRTEDNRHMLIDWEHGVTFDYQLAARVVLEKKKKRWIFRSGVITDSRIVYKHFIDSDHLVIDSISCDKCSEIDSLKGKKLSGGLEGDHILRLAWPVIRPVVKVSSHLNPKIKCAAGDSDCIGRKAPKSMDSSIEEAIFLLHAGQHALPLKKGSFQKSDKVTTGASPASVEHRYVMQPVAP
ncbi:MAG: hypothetical protein ABW098_16630 [Candidatus Thiodiazotropha sp.]